MFTQFTGTFTTIIFEKSNSSLKEKKTTKLKTAVSVPLSLFKS